MPTRPYAEPLSDPADAPTIVSAADPDIASAKEAQPLRFRGATLDDAIETAEAALGGRARVLAANHIRRGGIGGFFASDLGVEVSVVPDEETIEDALRRIVKETAAQEREGWRDRAATTVDSKSAIDTFARAMQQADIQTAIVETRATPEYVPALAALALVAAVPVTPPTALQAAVDPVPSVIDSTVASRLERMEAAFASLRATTSVTQRTPAAAPSRRQVELAIAATEQLIDTINTRANTARLSVRVTVRAAHGAEVEACAEWGTASTTSTTEVAS
jgi:flagellar biosynthesis GTPase FlhF